ncbi:NAD(P)H:quinone oxidoreductase, type IV [Kwoniella shivajii]|uniref:NAD(P)H:quinone oxidoreductase, type IV n=1 Tax=Kwoniella shivajii TaxID=564305 RepID=A0ABZ1D003_9TREE|nr:NAD(P)H:quinone oxidoreductase, type IV [Kwoniella shivajii]
MFGSFIPSSRMAKRGYLLIFVNMSSKPIIVVAFYSTYGHIDALATEVIKGVESAGAIAKPYVIKETLPQEVLTKMYANTSLQSKYPTIAPEDLKEADGIIFGAPTRYGRLPSQVDAFFDATGGLWAAGSLTGKFTTLFTSAAGQHSGLESTILTTFPFFAHHGRYSNPAIGGVDVVQGGSPYGASTVAAGDGHLMPTTVDLEVAHHQGKYFANFVGTYKKGKAAATSATSTTAAAVVPATTTSSGAARDIPEKVAGEPTLDGYALGAPIAASSEKPSSVTTATATSTPAETGTTTAAATPTPVETTSTPKETTTTPKEPIAAETPVPAATKETVPVATKETAPAASTPAPVKKAEQKPKKKGFFSCCDDSSIDK